MLKIGTECLSSSCVSHPCSVCVSTLVCPVCSQMSSNSHSTDLYASRPPFSYSAKATLSGTWTFPLHLGPRTFGFRFTIQQVDMTWMCILSCHLDSTCQGSFSPFFQTCFFFPSERSFDYPAHKFSFPSRHWGEHLLPSHRLPPGMAVQIKSNDALSVSCHKTVNKLSGRMTEIVSFLETRYYRCFFLVLPKFSSVWFSPHFLRTKNQTDRFFSELNRTRTELFRTGSNHRTARNFEKCTLHKFYTLKLIAASNLCLNYFVLMLFEGTSARKHEIDKALPYLAMTNHSKLRKPCQ